MYVLYKFGNILCEIKSDGDNLMYVTERLLLLGTVVHCTIV